MIQSKITNLYKFLFMSCSLFPSRLVFEVSEKVLPELQTRECI
jgi:hypothetical protein